MLPCGRRSLTRRAILWAQGAFSCAGKVVSFRQRQKTKALGLLVEREGRGSLRTVTAIVLFVSALGLLGNATLSLWPGPNEAPTRQLRTSRDLVLAYSRIRPGLTRASELARYGFDPASKGTQLLSYLGVMERVIPHDSHQFDQLGSAIQECVAARERCTALVFHPSEPARTSNAHGVFTAFSMGADAASRAPQVMLLIRDGRVTFKTISGAIERVRANQSQREARAVPVPFRMSD